MLAVREEGENACGLSQGLDHQHPWHHRVAWEVPLKEGLVDGDVLQRPNGSAKFNLEHPIHEEKRVAMRKALKNGFYGKGIFHRKTPFSRGGAGETDARAHTITWSAQDRQLTFEGDAVIEQNGNLFRGDTIHYDTARRVVTADGGQGTGAGNGRVEMVIQPRTTRQEQESDGSTQGQ